MDGPTSVRVAELGPLSIALDDGDLVSVRGHVSIRALSFLLLRGQRGAQIDEVVEVCWPQQQPATARRSLANTVRRLRRLLGRDAIVTEGSNYLIGAGVTSDRYRFVSCLSAAREALATRRNEAARESVDEALELWRGEPWFGLDDSDLFLADRMVLEEAHRELVGIRATAARQSGDFIASIAAWQDLVGLDPYRELSWIELANVTAAASGRREGLRVLQQARSRLTEVGLDASPQLIDAEHRLADPQPSSPRSQISGATKDRLRQTFTDPSLPFVGRSAELQRLGSLYPRTGHGQVRAAFLGGLAGVGKTRLAHESLVARDDLQVIVGRCLEGLDSPLGPFADFLYLSDLKLDEAGLGMRARYRPEGAGEPSDGRDRAPSTGAVADAERRRDALIISQLVLDHARGRPSVLLIDDLHWASALVLLIVEVLLAHTERSPLTIVATCRTNPPDLASETEARIAELAARPNAEYLELGPLTLDDVEALARHHGLPGHADSLYAQSGGNAFFLVESLRGERTNAPAMHLESLIRARLAAIHPAATYFLASGAFVGLEFPTGPSADAAGLSGAEADTLIDDLHRAGFLVETNRVAGRSQFAHALVAQVVRASLGIREQQRLRLGLARSLQRHGFPNTVWIESLLRAGPLVDDHTASEAALAAAERFSATRNDDAAIQILELLLKRELPARAAARPQVQLSLALRRSGRHTEGRIVALRAATSATADGDGVRLADAALAYSVGGAWADNADQTGPELLERALTLIDDDELTLRARLTARLSGWAIFTSSLDERDRKTGEALDLARRSGSTTALADALNARQIAVSCPRMLHESARLDDELARLERAGLAQSELANRPTPATYWEADGERFRREIAQRQIDHQPGLPDPMRHCLLAVVASHDGRLDDARLQQQSVRSDRQTDVDTGNFTWLGVTIDWLAGDPTVSLDQVEDATDRLGGLPLRLTAAWLRAAAGNLEGAQDTIDRIRPGRLDTLPELFLGGFGLAGAAMTAAHLGDRDLGRHLSRILEPLADQMIGVPWASYPCASFFLGVLAHASGNTQRADSWFARANEIHEAMMARSFTALTNAHWSLAIHSLDRQRSSQLADAATTFAHQSQAFGTLPEVARIGSSEAR